MNQREWNDAVERLQRLLEPNFHSMENVSRSNWDTYCEYPRYTVPEPHRSDVGWKELSPSSHHVYSKAPEMEDPDGEPLQGSGEDAELARKKKQLREIEEKIMHKKASIAMKAVFVESSTPPGVSGDEQLATCEGETLRDRVKEILRHRQHLSYLSKFQSTRERKNSSSLSKDGVLQEEHPLKLRVKALMRRRRSVLPSNSSEVPDVPRSPPGRSVTSPAKREDIINKGFECFLSVLNKGADISLFKPEDNCGEAPDVSLPFPGRSISSPAKEENNINKGFERFLNILNKGVDIEQLSRIMSNDREDLPLGEEPLSIQLPDMESKSDPFFRSERQQTSSGGSLLGISQASEKQRLNRGALLESLSQTSKSLHTMDNDAEPDLSRTKESQRLSSGASLPGHSPPSENQRSNARPAQRSLSQAKESQRSKSGSSLKGLSQASKTQQSKSGQAKKTKDSPRRPHTDKVLQSGASLVGQSRTNITKINSPSREQPRSERRSLPAAEEKKKDRGDHSLGSSSRSNSPVTVKKKKEEEREESPSVSEQHEQLQNILKTLGWNLDVEELSKLAKRTHERLYGKKNEGADSREAHGSQPKRSHDSDRRTSSSSRSPLRSNKADRSQQRTCGRKSEGSRRTESREEEETRQRRSPRDHRKSPSSSSSSRAASSPSPSRQQRSRSRGLKQRRKVERSRSGERRKDRQSSREAQRDQKDLKHFSPFPYPQNQMFPHPAASAFPDYLSSQCSHFALSHSGHYSGATNPYCTYNQYNIPPTLSASSHPYTHFSGSVVAPNMSYPDPSFLTVSERKVRRSSAPRCLTVINTEQASSQDLTGDHEELMGDFRNPEDIFEKHDNTPVEPEESKVYIKSVDDANAEPLEEEKPQPTEEEIKANLRKKLQAFNQKAKNTSQLPHRKVMQPVNSLISEME
ncbi:serine/arginine repetitive matrix protein 1-like [Archocentrus centrarchus]|uniref:serine/arginine repetitive matrix protein 1-like n=1 Tax=Archocentrus centrarchus TaxID=63155 RepID=UPI0011EA14DE|nr:serine/arginine repetitive matrix protein 1-like [Archocentrus centrarchus]